MNEVVETTETSLKEDSRNALRGVLMGGADAIPGVSGGTVALIVGIYARLVTAISHVDLRLVGHLKARQWSAAIRYLDLRFLISLGIGIGVGLVAMAVLANILMNEYRALTLAAFFGMIIASGFLVVKMVRRMGNGDPIVLLMLGAAGGAFAFWLSTLGYSSNGSTEPSYLFLFASGCLAICAMILPGISGAMVLLILGPYEYVTGSIRQLVKFQSVGPNLVTLIVFGSGCAISLVCFSKILRKLLERFPAQATSLLCGFMFGALPKLWPFQVRVGEHREFENVWPRAFDAQVWAAIGIALAAAVFVLTVDRVSRGHQQEPFLNSTAGTNPERAVGP